MAPDSVFEAQSDANLSLALVAPVVEYRQQEVNTLDKAANSKSYVLVLDGNLPCDEVKAAVTSMQALLLEEANRGTHVEVALVVFDERVCIYQLGIIGMASADVYPSLPEDKEELDEEALIQRRLRMENRSYFVQVRSEDDLAILWLCLSAVYGVQVQHSNGGGTDAQGSSGSEPPSRKEKLRLRKEARLRKEMSGSLEQKAVAMASSAVSPWVSMDTGPPLRCTGEATQCAVDLAIFGPLQEPRSSRILLFTNGCPNVGVGSVVHRTLNDEGGQKNGHGIRPTPHSVDANQMAKSIQYFEVAGKYATENGIGIDVFCTGAESLGIPAFQALVKPSEGYALSHDSFSSPQLAHNLSYIVLQTQMSIAVCEEVGGATESVGSPSVLNQLEGCIADIRISSFLTPTHIVGAGEVLDGDNQGLLVNERHAFAAESSFAASRGFETSNKPTNEVLAEPLTRIRFGRLIRYRQFLSCYKLMTSFCQTMTVMRSFSAPCALLILLARSWSLECRQIGFLLR